VMLPLLPYFISLYLLVLWDSRQEAGLVSVRRVAAAV